MSWVRAVGIWVFREILEIKHFSDALQASILWFRHLKNIGLNHYFLIPKYRVSIQKISSWESTVITQQRQQPNNPITDQPTRDTNTWPTNQTLNTNPKNHNQPQKQTTNKQTTMRAFKPTKQTNKRGKQTKQSSQGKQKYELNYTYSLCHCPTE